MLKGIPRAAIVICSIYIIIISFALYGLLRGISWPEQDVSIQLDTYHMKQTDDRLLDSISSVKKIFSCNRDNQTDDYIKWADVYLCTAPGFETHPGGGMDTLLIFDTHTGLNNNPKYELDAYWVELRRSNTLRQCKVIVPRSFADKVYKYKYTYAHVLLITDD